MDRQERRASDEQSSTPASPSKDAPAAYFEAGLRLLKAGQLPDYRRLLDRDGSPWYPSAKLFRQDQRRDYASVLERMREELRPRIDAFRP